MRISDLSRESGLSIPTIKFYLREGLLHPGEPIGRNQARYDGGHLRRLHLVRVLVDVGGLSLTAVRRVLSALERRDASLHDVLAEAHAALGHDRFPGDDRMAAARRDSDAWLATTGWLIGPDSPARDELAAALAALRRLEWDVGADALERYRAAADVLAEGEIDYVAGMPDRAAAVEATVIGTVLFERILVALRRLAEEHHSRRRFGNGRSAGT
jgi:DNA-binding transcriptional MerR regulator